MWRKPPTAILWMAIAMLSSGTQHDRVARHELADGHPVVAGIVELHDQVALGQDAGHHPTVLDDEAADTGGLHLAHRVGNRRAGTDGQWRMGVHCRQWDVDHLGLEGRARRGMSAVRRSAPQFSHSSTPWMFSTPQDGQIIAPSQPVAKSVTRPSKFRR